MILAVLRTATLVVFLFMSMFLSVSVIGEAEDYYIEVRDGQIERIIE